MSMLRVSLLLAWTALLVACALPGYDRYPRGSGVPVRDASGPQQAPEQSGEEPAPEPEVIPMEPAPAPTVEPLPAPTVEPLPAPDRDAAGEIQRGPAVQSLLDKAEAYRRQGRLGDAAASLERAQRIAPRDAEVYYRLAEVRLAQGNAVQAEQTAQKALAYAAGRRALQADIWMLIARARADRGDQAGSDAAEEEARRYQREAGSWWR